MSNKYWCDCFDNELDELCDACIQADLDKEEAEAEELEASREYWANKEADFAYDPLSRKGFE